MPISYTWRDEADPRGRISEGRKGAAIHRIEQSCLDSQQRARVVRCDVTFGAGDNFRYNCFTRSGTMIGGGAAKCGKPREAPKPSRGGGGGGKPKPGKPCKKGSPGCAVMRR
ncbi:unnamed protein product [Clonostachys byssicola]|uniref:Uncharacterized protein n=1 Tax=Clonostachys byssicola TaxID=160290 RepID=A0A9N9UD31_9HYPO|nr:unnamed protein product [Clonostachys byssicola]